MVSRSSCSMVTRSRKSKEVATVKAAGVRPVLQVWFGVQQPDERERELGIAPVLEMVSW